jgi:hypothetical protein
MSHCTSTLLVLELELELELALLLASTPCWAELPSALCAKSWPVVAAHHCLSCSLAGEGRSTHSELWLQKPVGAYVALTGKPAASM